MSLESRSKIIQNVQKIIRTYPKKNSKHIRKSPNKSEIEKFCVQNLSRIVIETDCMFFLS